MMGAETRKSRTAKKPVPRWRIWLSRAMLAVVLSAVVAYVIVDVVLGSRFEARLKAIREAGDPVTVDDLAPKGPLEGENGATCYLKAFPLVRALSDNETALFLDRRPKARATTPADVERRRELVTRMGEALDLLRRGAACPEARFAFDNDALLGHGTTLYGSGCVNAARLLALSSNLRATDGRGDEALSDLAAILALGRAVGSERTIMSMLIGNGAESKGLRQAASALDSCEPSEAALESLRREIARVGNRSDLVAAFKGERAIGLTRMRLLRTDPGRILEQPPESPRMYRLEMALMHPFELRAALDYLDEADGCLACAAEDPWTALPKARALAQQRPGLGILRLLSGLFSLGGDRMVEAHAGLLAERDAAQWLIALRLYRMHRGQYPDALEGVWPQAWGNAPVDPFTGKPFVYRRDEDGKGFVLYSVGPNGVDNNGKAPSDLKEADDVVFRVSR